MDLLQIIRRDYETALERNGLSYSPEQFLSDLDTEEFIDCLHLDVLAEYENDVSEDYPFLEWDSNRFGELVESRIKVDLDDITPDDLEDVRYDMADDAERMRNPDHYYGVSRSNFYGV